MLELTNGSPGGNEDGISIRLGDYDIDRNNNFITFKDAANLTVGRIEGFDVSNGDWAPPNVNFDSGLDDDLAAVACYLQLKGFGRPPTNPVDAAFFVADLAIAAACLDGGVVYASGSGDFAEWLPKLDPNEEIGIGDVVGLFGGKISKRTEGASQLMAVSTAPIVLGNEPEPGEEDNYVKVGFIGQIPIEIIGTVNKDDFIIPSGMQNGTAIAVSPEQLLLKDYSKIIGRAWEESSHFGVKLINCVIGVDSNEWSRFVDANEIRIAEVQEENKVLKSEVAQLRDELDQINGIASEFASLKASMELIQASLNKSRGQQSPSRGQQLARALIQP